jgi:penicillin G amidase
MLSLLVSACAALYPRAVSTAERIARFPTVGLPLDQPVEVRWNQWQVPYVLARSDHDLFFTLGLVHAHLRSAQLAVLKRVAYGRLAEMGGPPMRDIDHALRILDFSYAAGEIKRAMPSETRAALEAFVAGLNHYQATQSQSPPELGLLGIRPEPWSAIDLITIGRLAGSDVNWLVYFPLLAAHGRPGFQELWERMIAVGSDGAVSFRATPEQAFLLHLLNGMSRSGSNSVAVAASRSASGGALIASDPHLGFWLPNFWLLAGIRSPSYHGVGLMVPGLPFIAVGRTPHMAWGGTNMRAASSDLYDVSGIPPEQIGTIHTRIKVRLWFDRTERIRRTPFGPIISDAAVIPKRPGDMIALRWVGHEVTDEITCFLRALRARTVDELRSAFASFGVSAQNAVFADSDGNIGQFMAVTQPIRSAFAAGLILDASDPATHWKGFARTLDLPFAVNPAEGFLASANNRPTDTPVPIGFFFSSDDRVRRLQQLLLEAPATSVADLRNLQTDTHSPDALRLTGELVKLAGVTSGVNAQHEILLRLHAWDGDYRVDSGGAVAFESLLFHLLPAVYGATSVQDTPQLFRQWNYISRLFAKDLTALDPARRGSLIAAALDAAAGDVARFAQWGEMHRMRVAHLLGSVPVIGARFVVEDFAVGGSRETPMKTSHDLVHERHYASYGSQARHISDMSDPDSNYFVLLGGQDGWLGSANYADQVSLWRERNYIRIPLRPEVVAADFPTVIHLQPRAH